MEPKYPLYIVSKGRADSRLTVKALERMRVSYHIVVEAQEYDRYAAVIDSARILILDPTYQQDYDTYDDLGESKSKGPGPARNFVWDHAIERGYPWHWVIDDNIWDFFRLHQNMKIPVHTAAFFRTMEDFVDRYQNIAMAGPSYFMFAKRKDPSIPPFVLNTRIYSCNLIRNDVPFRWRGRYNEDTILSLDMLKAGWCTVHFYALLQGKMPTQRMKGGNTDEFYVKEGTIEKSKMLVRLHPDVTRLVWKFGRVHHHVDYRPFKYNTLKRRPDVVIPDGSNEYGMRLVQVSAD